MGQSYCTGCNCKQKEETDLEVTSKPNYYYHSNSSSFHQPNLSNSNFSKLNINEKNKNNNQIHNEITKKYKKSIKKIILLQANIRGFLFRKNNPYFRIKQNDKKEINSKQNTFKFNSITNHQNENEKIEITEVKNEEQFLTRYVQDYILKNGSKYSGILIR